MMNFRKKLNGFTLVELMITIVIIAILAAIAYPTYTAQVRRTARQEAIGVVLDVAGRLERIRSQLMAYPTAAADLTNLGQTTKRYGVTVVSTGATFTITAAPSGDQTGDLCGTFTYTNVGLWTFGNSQTEANCL